MLSFEREIETAIRKYLCDCLPRDSQPAFYVWEAHGHEDPPYFYVKATFQGEDTGETDFNHFVIEIGGKDVEDSVWAELEICFLCPAIQGALEACRRFAVRRVDFDVPNQRFSEENYFHRIMGISLYLEPMEATETI